MFRIFTNDKRVLRDLHSVGVEAGFAKDMSEVIEALTEDLKESDETLKKELRRKESTYLDTEGPNGPVIQDKKGRIFYAQPDGTINCNCPEGECALEDNENSAQPPSMKDEHMTDLTLGPELSLVIEDGLRWWLAECTWSSVHGQVSYILQRFLKARISEVTGDRTIEKIDRYDIDLLSRVLIDFGTYANVHTTLKRLAMISGKRLDRLC